MPFCAFMARTSKSSSALAAVLRSLFLYVFACPLLLKIAGPRVDKNWDMIFKHLLGVNPNSLVQAKYMALAAAVPPRYDGRCATHLRDGVGNWKFSRRVCFAMKCMANLLQIPTSCVISAMRTPSVVLIVHCAQAGRNVEHKLLLTSEVL